VCVCVRERERERERESIFSSVMYCTHRPAMYTVRRVAYLLHSGVAQTVQGGLHAHLRQHLKQSNDTTRSSAVVLAHACMHSVCFLIVRVCNIHPIRARVAFCRHV